MLRFLRLFDTSGQNFAYPFALSSHVINPGFSLRPLADSDEQEWQHLRTENREWLTPWDASDPLSRDPLSFHEWIRAMGSDAHSGTAVVLAMMESGHMVGEVSLGAISYGSLRSGIVGYWIDRDHAGRGLTPLAVAMVADWAFFDSAGPRLHRLELALLPTNSNSRRVAQKVGFTFEGVRRHYMHVAGQWRDHETWSLLAEDVPQGAEVRLAQLREQGSQDVHAASAPSSTESVD